MYYFTLDLSFPLYVDAFVCSVFVVAVVVYVFVDVHDFSVFYLIVLLIVNFCIALLVLLVL